MNEKFLRNSAMFMTSLSRQLGAGYAASPVARGSPLSPGLPNPFTIGDDVATNMRAQASYQVASTGTPIRDLHGVARADSIDAVLGGGSLQSGGGGIEAGRAAVADASKSATRYAFAGWGLELAAQVAVPCAIAAAEVVWANMSEKKAQRRTDDEA